MTSVFSQDLYKGKVCLITGGSRGGMLKETAKQYLIHGAQAVVLMSRNKEKNDQVCQELSQFGKCISEPGDVTKVDDCKRVVENIVRAEGRIDVLLNGAAGNFLASAERLSVNGFKRVLEIDTVGTFNMCQAVFKGAFKSQKSGVIINISANLHWQGAWGQSHSSAAKAGVDALTRVLANEWGPHGVRVVGLVPGAIEGTEGFERLGDFGNINNKERTNKAFEKKGASSHKMIEFVKAVIPAQRFGKTTDIANAALFLGSPAASYVTGSLLVVDGAVSNTMPNMFYMAPQFVGPW
eukprot:CAMPEP_0170482730 /NCGR_PEP_ID=MMETSP0208-20121228/2618_1 /TAXON_ID=197538 /ORGANISM="Strombidium inclinatum, Strain S3" /LENGTH=294 /DNA_ID=CAMNT_0010755593 /DNA_START=4 /DNA_END=885 /DNA_ORIENTATION=+